MSAKNQEKITSENVEESVLTILAETLDIPRVNIHPASSLVGDLGMDSFAAVELMFELEEKAGIVIPDEEVKKFQKVSDIVDYIRPRVPIEQK